nr:Uncharacterised protein [Streptococcus thermophilus]
MSNQWNHPAYDDNAGGQPHGHQYGQQQPYPPQPGQPAASPYAAMPQNDTSAGGIASGLYVFASCVLPLLAVGAIVLAFIGVLVLAGSDSTSTPTPTSVSTTATTADGF